MEFIYTIITAVNDFLWGPPMIVSIFALGIYLTVKLGFIQKYLFKSIKLSVSPDDAAGEVSNFGALAVTIAATVGTGSIIGVTTAIAEGGPGAVFWLIIAGIFNFATKYSECLLSVKYRTKNSNGEYVGGPMYVMANRLNMRWMGVIYAIGILFMSFTGGSILQSNSIADSLRAGYAVNPIYVSLIVSAVAAVVIIGGVKRITMACEFLVPIMGVLYLIAAFSAVWLHFDRLPGVFVAVLEGAFTGKAALGGALGIGIMAVFKGMVSAMQFGVSRSVLATESAMGSAGIVAAAAKTPVPAKQGLISATSVFWTVFVCCITGLVVLLAGDWQNPDVYAANLCNSAFTTIPYIGTPILIFSLSVFSFTTIIGWAYYGEKAIEFLENVKWVKYFRIVMVLLIAAGAVMGTTFTLDFFLNEELCSTTATNTATRMLWGLAILTMTFMTIPNIICIWLLRKDIKEETDANLKQLFK